MKRNKLITLPKEIYDKIKQTGLTKAYQHKAFAFVNELIIKSNQFNDYPCGFYSYEANRIRGKYGRKYSEFVSKLKQNSIIEVDESYSTKLGICKKYKVNSRYYYATDEVVTVEISVQKSEKKPDQFLQGLINFNKTLQPYSQLLEDKIKRVLDDITRENLILNENILNGTYAIKSHNKKEYYRHTDFIIPYAKRQNLDAILYKEIVYLYKIEDFIKSKRLDIKLNYQNSINNLIIKNLYTKINTTNGRLDTNFTNMPKALLNEIAIKNNLCEIDITASQPTLLANIAGKEVDINFYHDALSGNLYEQMQKMYNCDRETAKQVFMRLVFSHSKYNTDAFKQQKDMFALKYHGICNYISQFKGNELPIRLQKEESNIMVNNVLRELYACDINCISKHDSIICRAKDLDKVKTVIIDKTKSYKLNFKTTIANTGIITNFSNY